MSGTPMRGTEARVAERERRRKQEERRRQLRWEIPLVVVGVLLALAGVYLSFGNKPSASSDAGAKGPHIQLAVDKIDLGDEPLGKTVHASFDVRNTGDAPLTLNAAQTAVVLKGC